MNPRPFRSLSIVFAAACVAASALLAGCGGGGAAAVGPAIVSQPASQTVVAGATASFAVAASGDAPLSYQWQRDGADIVGATSVTFTVAGALLPDDGRVYQAKVSNAAGVAVTSPALLSVTPAGTVTLVAGAIVLPGEPAPAETVNGPAASARFTSITGLAVDSGGSIFVTDYQGVRKITPAGDVSTLARRTDDRPYFSSPRGLAIDSKNTLYLVDGFPPVFGLYWCCVSAIAPDGAVRTVKPDAGPFGLPAIAADRADNIYVYGGAGITRISSAGVVMRLGAPTAAVRGIASAPDGTLYAAIDHAIVKIASGQPEAWVAGMATAGSADGPALQAQFNFSRASSRFIATLPAPMVADSLGNVYVADDNGIRRVAKDGTVTTLTGRPGLLRGVGVRDLADRPIAPLALALAGDKVLLFNDGGAVLKLALP